MQPRGLRDETLVVVAGLVAHLHVERDALEFAVLQVQLNADLDVAGEDVELLCEALGAPELASDPKYKTNPDRVDHAEELAPVLEPLFRKKTTAEWEAQLLEAGVPCGAVGDYLEFFENPQVTAMDMNPVVDHPKIGPLRLAGVPLHFSKTPGAIQRTAPALGEHTMEILEELGMDASKIQTLKDGGVIA